MQKNRKLIEESIQDRPAKVSVRSIACEQNCWSEFIELTEAIKRFIYNTSLIDGVKIKTRYTTVTFNARHNLF